MMAIVIVCAYSYIDMEKHKALNDWMHQENQAAYNKWRTEKHNYQEVVRQRVHTDLKDKVALKEKCWQTILGYINKEKEHKKRLETLRLEYNNLIDTYNQRVEVVNGLKYDQSEATYLGRIRTAIKNTHRHYSPDSVLVPRVIAHKLANKIISEGIYDISVQWHRYRNDNSSWYKLVFSKQ